ncbi:inorganic diphosphatase [Streptomyces reniochalinae]|uniref:Inorganic pyrophosphatase n=1 Tax=Streptomyces reniochalinae TaxID=2250578 RepID=A0A367EL66_9ACTN|nr:inorganic diphosphatase [Streptomyces reniochalinae]RCG18703.1 inorganic diphosphatase [Streptomyces reniochalinae]
MSVDVVIEIPRGSRNKYEMDHTTNRIRLDRLLFTRVGYPTDYGFIEGTLGRDGDPLDALLLAAEATFPGCAVACRPVGMLVMSDEKGPDEKVLCVPDGDPRYAGVRDIDDVDRFTQQEIAHFFTVYKDLETGKSVEVSHWVGRTEAEAEIVAAFARVEGGGA